MMRIAESIKKLNAMREVSVIMHYGVHEHEDIISPNIISFQPITDIIDGKSVEVLRGLWLTALSQPEQSADIIEESVTDKFKRLLGKALAPAGRSGGLDEHFIRAAAYPVPSEYVVRLPVKPKDLRVEIINCLVPFEKTRQMLLRLEDKLEAPMRALQIGHVAVNSMEELKASMAYSSSPGLRYN